MVIVTISSGMVSQLQGYGVRIQIDLLSQVSFLVLPHIVVDQGDRDDEGDDPFAVLHNNYAGPGS